MRIYPTTCVISFVEDLKLHYNNLSHWIRGLYTVYREGTLHTLTSVSLQNTKTLLALYSESKFTMSFLRANVGVHSQEMGCKKPYLLYYDALPYLSKRVLRQVGDGGLRPLRFFDHSNDLDSTNQRLPLQRCFPPNSSTFEVFVTYLMTF